MLTSLFLHNQQQSFRVFILVSPLFSDTNRNKVLDSLRRWGREVEFLTVQEQEFSEVKVDDHVTRESYYRLCVPDLLPKEITVALYLDSDLIVNGCILELLNIDISRYTLAAVPDPLVDEDVIIKAKLNLGDRARYFNAGVLMINVERWRVDRIGPRALQFARKHSDLITYWDQCALNHIVRGEYCILNRKWNLQRHHMVSEFSNRVEPVSVEEASSAAIIHFTTVDKPWLFLCSHPMKYLYFEYLKYTAWWDFIEPDRTKKNQLKKYIRLHYPLAERILRGVYVLCKRVFYLVRSKRMQ